MALEDMIKDLPAYIPDSEEEVKAADEQAKDEAARQEAMKNRGADLARVADLKQSIARQIDKGNAPQIPLVAALDALGIVTRDKAWADACKASLEAYAPGATQQSMLEDTASKEILAQQEQTAKYLKTTVEALQKRLKATQKIQDGIMFTIARLGDLEDLI